MKNQPMIYVGMIDNDYIFYNILQSYLKIFSYVSCQLLARSMEEYWSIINRHKLPDVILLNSDFLKTSGIQGVKLLKGQYPELEIIIFSLRADSGKIIKALNNGASGYLLKSDSPELFLRAIHAVHIGEAFMSPLVTRKVIEYFHKKPERPKEHPLSNKEREVVTGLAEGLSYKMIACQMDVSLETVRSHIKNIYRKLMVNSKIAVIQKCHRGEI